VHNTELTLHEALSMRLCKHVIDRSRLAHRELLARIEQGATAQPGLFLDLVPKFQIKVFPNMANVKYEISLPIFL
jgi:hypothetical protein